MINLGKMAGIALAVWMSGLAARGDTQTVVVGSYSFTPANITVKQGDTIIWTNRALITHDSAQGSATTPASQRLWASPNLSASIGNYRFTFTNTGFFPYLCLQHAVTHPEQTGSVSVVEGNFAPTVSLTSPTPGSRHPAPPNFFATASATDPDGTVTNVFYTATPNVAGGIPIQLGSAAASPFSVRITNLDPATYQFRAIATDNKGLSSTSSFANISITVPVPLVMSSAGVNPQSQFQFDLSTSLGLLYVVEEAGDIAGPWSPTSTNSGSSTSVRITRPYNSASPNQKFYRAYIQP